MLISKNNKFDRKKYIYYRYRKKNHQVNKNI